MASGLRFGVIGPGRVGQALARRWVLAGHECLGFLGRDPSHGMAASRACGWEQPGLERFDQLSTATFVLVAVDDDAIASVGEQAASRGGVRACSLWLHCSGSHGLEPLRPVEARGGRIGILHPLCPFPDADQGFVGMVGQPAVLTGEANVLRLLGRLAHDLSMCAHWLPPDADRKRYHAACALAANGVTALCALVESMFASVATVEDASGESPMLALMASALEACRRQGTDAALSGPVERGDVATVRGHLAALGGDRELAVYRALMEAATDLSARRGHAPPKDLDAIRRLLDPDSNAS